MTAAPAATASAGAIPEELCAHRELRDCWSLSRGYCRDCGSWVDLSAMPAVSLAEHERAIEKAEELSYENGEADQATVTERVREELAEAEEDLRTATRELGDLRADVSRAITLLGDRAPDVATMLESALDAAP